MVRCIFCVLLSSVFMGFFFQLLGQASSDAKPKTKVIYKEKSYYDFEDVLINGNIRKPDGSFIFRKNQSAFSSALNLKRSFIPELKESAKSVR